MDVSGVNNIPEEGLHLRYSQYLAGEASIDDRCHLWGRGWEYPLNEFKLQISTLKLTEKLATFECESNGRGSIRYEGVIIHAFHSCLLPVLMHF